MRCGARQRAKAAAAPATVDGERAPSRGHWETGKAGRAPRSVSQETGRHARQCDAVGRGVLAAGPDRS